VIGNSSLRALKCTQNRDKEEGWAQLVSSAAHPPSRLLGWLLFNPWRQRDCGRNGIYWISCSYATWTTLSHLLLWFFSQQYLKENSCGHFVQLIYIKIWQDSVYLFTTVQKS
jgi:hypothetical protein